MRRLKSRPIHFIRFMLMGRYQLSDASHRVNVQIGVQKRRSDDIIIVLTSKKQNYNSEGSIDHFVDLPKRTILLSHYILIYQKIRDYCSRLNKITCIMIVAMLYPFVWLLLTNSFILCNCGVYLKTKVY